MKKTLFILFAILIWGGVVGCSDDSSNNTTNNGDIDKGNGTYQEIADIYLPNNYPIPNISNTLNYTSTINSHNTRELTLTTLVSDEEFNQLINTIKGYYSCFTDNENGTYSGDSENHTVILVYTKNNLMIKYVFKQIYSDITTPTISKGEGIEITTFGEYAKNFIFPNFPITSLSNKKVVINDNKPISLLEHGINYKTTHMYAKGEIIEGNYPYNFMIGEPDTGEPVNIRDELSLTDSFSESDRVSLFNTVENSHLYSNYLSSCGWSDYYNSYQCIFNGVNRDENIRTTIAFSHFGYTKLPYRNYKNLLHKGEYRWQLFQIENHQYIEPDIITDKDEEDYLSKNMPLKSPTDINAYLPDDYNKELAEMLSYDNLAYSIEFDDSTVTAPILTVSLNQNRNIQSIIEHIITAMQQSGYYNNFSSDLNEYNIMDATGSSADHDISIYTTKDSNIYIVHLKFSFKYDISTAPTIQ